MQNKAPWLLDILDMSSAELAKFEFVDIREAAEGGGQLLHSLLRRPVQSLPLSTINRMHPPINADKQYIFVCQTGRGSSTLVSELRDRGFDNVYALCGGVESVRRKYIA